VDALTPKDDLTRVFKQLQGNGLKDYLLEKEKGNVADTPEAKAAHIKKYITTKFEKHMINAETGPKATNMFNQEYPAKAEVIAAVAGLQSHFEPNPVVPAVGEQVDPVE
jgi:hypothetical protein